jgi:DNA-binding transcriptional LysR family regulator
VPIKSKAISNSGKLLRHLALSGLGIFLCASYCAEDALKNGELVRLLPDHHLGQLSVVMVYSSRRLLSAKVRSFVDFMCARFPNPSADPWMIKEERAAKIAKLAA